MTQKFTFQIQPTEIDNQIVLFLYVFISCSFSSDKQEKSTTMIRELQGIKNY